MVVVVVFVVVRTAAPTRKLEYGPGNEDGQTC